MQLLLSVITSCRVLRSRIGNCLFRSEIGILCVYEMCPPGRIRREILQLHRNQVGTWKMKKHSEIKKHARNGLGGNIGMDQDVYIWFWWKQTTNKYVEKLQSNARRERHGHGYHEMKKERAGTTMHPPHHSLSNTTTSNAFVITSTAGGVATFNSPLAFWSRYF
jgi:hypothetical protein